MSSKNKQIKYQNIDVHLHYNLYIQKITLIINLITTLSGPIKTIQQAIQQYQFLSILQDNSRVGLNLQHSQNAQIIQKESQMLQQARDFFHFLKHYSGKLSGRIRIKALCYGGVLGLILEWSLVLAQQCFVQAIKLLDQGIDQYRHVYFYLIYILDFQNKINQALQKSQSYRKKRPFCKCGKLLNKKYMILKIKQSQNRQKLTPSETNQISQINQQLFKEFSKVSEEDQMAILKYLGKVDNRLFVQA